MLAGVAAGVRLVGWLSLPGRRGASSWSELRVASAPFPGAAPPPPTPPPLRPKAGGAAARGGATLLPGPSVRTGTPGYPGLGVEGTSPDRKDSLVGAREPDGVGGTCELPRSNSPQLGAALQKSCLGRLPSCLQPCGIGWYPIFQVEKL